MHEKLSGALCLCRKAGRLIMGMDPAIEAMRGKKAVLLLLTQDLSERSVRQIRRVAEETQTAVQILDCTMEELYQYAGRHCGIYAVCDTGFARMLQGLLEKETPTEP